MHPLHFFEIWGLIYILRVINWLTASFCWWQKTAQKPSIHQNPLNSDHVKNTLLPTLVPWTSLLIGISFLRMERMKVCLTNLKGFNGFRVKITVYQSTVTQNWSWSANFQANTETFSTHSSNIPDLTMKFLLMRWWKVVFHRWAPFQKSWFGLLYCSAIIFPPTEDLFSGQIFKAHLIKY